MDGERLFIGKVAKQAGTNAKTIRYYEAIGLLTKPQRGENRYRLYPKEVVELLYFIRKAQGLGLRLSEIKEIVITDTLPVPDDKRTPKLTVLPVADMLGEAIHRIHNGLSVGALFT